MKAMTLTEMEAVKGGDINWWSAAGCAAGAAGYMLGTAALVTATGGAGIAIAFAGKTLAGVGVVASCSQISS